MGYDCSELNFSGHIYHSLVFDYANFINSCYFYYCGGDYDNDYLEDGYQEGYD